jgi:CheY-like chemotaxis protein
MTRRFGGAGLGLTISSQIIHAMGSEISVLSAPGEGSDFTFKLRLKVHRAKTTAEDSLNILYAEDNVINQMTAYKMLSSKGHRVQIVPNGRLAVEAVRTEDFDLVLMDNQMPELSGIEATVTIRALGFTIPIVAVTASTHPDDRETLLAAGMNEFVAKPFTFDQLHSAMSRALEFALDHVAAAPRGPSSV